ncbi:MAG TPA: sigma-70 family RNA polymerase sigma factor [Candidatus Limnocylindria bacterium]|nr:sigma-70 family RNA polymerase sigma factor [Candidatus Limnocylindria bacterium]
MGAEAVGILRAGQAGGALPPAFERLFRAEYARVVRIAQRALGDQDEAEDVAQDVFLSFYRAHPADASYAASWLHAGAAHAALNAIRTRKRRAARDAAHLAEREARAGADPETEVIVAEERDAARAALGRIPARSATVLVLRYSGLSYREVAEAVGLPADQVGTAIRRAEEAFKKEVMRDGAE